MAEREEEEKRGGGGWVSGRLSERAA